MAVNGGSLEDCFLNVFALTELNGLKWRCFVTPANAPRGVPVPSDTVLKAYANCLQDGLICTWRRKPLPLPLQPEPLPVPSFTNDISKELWIFWYTVDPPESMAAHTSQLETVSNGADENGPGSGANIIYIEVRNLFIKALDTMIKRSSYRNGYLRMGRWMAKPLRQPVAGKQHLISHYMLAHAFRYFVHGGNIVCATVDAQRQPTLLRISKRHLECGSRIEVLLAPWSKRGVLIPFKEWEDSARLQASADRQWDEWKAFFPLEIEMDDSSDGDTKREDGVPRMVTVEIDRVRMLYPSPFVCLTLEVDTACQRAAEEAKADAEAEEPGVEAPRKVSVPTPVATAVRSPCHPEMTPAELIAPDGSRRNPLLVSNVHGFAHTQGVLQNAFVGRRQPQAAPVGEQETFREPFPVQADDDTRWNFVDPGRNVACSRHCTSCSFQPPVGFRGETKETPAKHCELAYPIPVTNPAFDSQKRTNPAYYALHRQSRRKDRHSYHGRWSAAGSGAPGSPVPSTPTADAAFLPGPSTSSAGPSTSSATPASISTAVPNRSRSPASEGPSSSDDEGMLMWANGGRPLLSTGIYCSTDHASKHYNPAAQSPALSSDEERPSNFSPFTPIRVISPCSASCVFSSAPAEMIPESQFNEIFQPGSSRVPLTASREERARDYDYYYNPTLRNEPSYAPYHSKRREKRRPFYPPQIIMPSSPEQPGSQETIPATSSPPPELEDRRRANTNDVDMAPESSYRIPVSMPGSSADEMVPRARRLRKMHRHSGWPQVDSLNVVAAAENHGEDIVCKVDASCGRVSPGDISDSDVSTVYNYDGDSEEGNRSYGEGTCYDDPSLFPSTSAMEVDGPLSPPASNERVDAFAHMSGQYSRVCGPPSVGDAASMNQIYPTPPSVLVESQQFSPIAAAISYGGQTNTTDTQSHPISALDLMPNLTMRTVKHEPIDEPMEVAESILCRREPSPPRYIEEPEEPETFPISENSRLMGFLSKIGSVPVSGKSRKFAISSSGRFNLPEKTSPAARRLAVRASTSVRLPEYRKETPSVPERRDRHNHQLPSTSASTSRGLAHPHHHQHSQHSLLSRKMGPGSLAGNPNAAMQMYYSGNIPNGSVLSMVPQTAAGGDSHDKHYQISFERQPHIPLSAHQVQMQNQMNHYGHNAQMRGGPMNPMMVGRAGGMTPYGAPGPMAGVGGGYGAAHQNVPVQQLNNFVNGQMQPMYGMGGMGGPGNPMTGSPHVGMYPGQQQMMGPSGSGMMPYGGMDSHHMGAQSPMTPGGYLPSSGQFGHPGGSMQHQQQQQALMQQQHMRSQQNMLGMPHPPGGYPQMPGPMGGMMGGPSGSGGMPHHAQMQSPHHHQQQLPHPHHMPYPVQQQQQQQQNYSGHSGQMQMQQHHQQQQQQQQQQLAIPSVPKEPPHVEGSSVVLAIILQDTILDLHYDTVFDSCPICSCNTSIKARELGLYITPSDVLRMPSEQQKQFIKRWSGFYVSEANQGNSCNCGFSAVRHRYLSYQSGLFPEDSKEATATVSDISIAPVAMQFPDSNLPAGRSIWFDPTSAQDVYMLNLIRILCLKSSAGMGVHHIAAFGEYADKAIKGQDIGFSVGSNAEYLISQIDSTELMLLGNSTIEMSLLSNAGAKRANTNMRDQRFLDYFHPWGLQVANEMRELKEAEWRAVLSELAPSLENAMRIARCADVSGSIVEGPLTWRALTNKRQKAQASNEDDSYLPEPIPCVVVACDKDLIRCAPQTIRHWDQLSLGPVDQPKDVLYLTVIPDNDEIHEKSVKYMEQLSQMYERMRLGRHIPYPTNEQRDGIIRVGGRNSGSNYARGASFDFIEMVGRHLGNRVFLSRLRLFTQQMEDALTALLQQNGAIFDRDAFRVELAKEAVAKRAATATLIEKIGASTSGGDGSAPMDASDEGGTPGPPDSDVSPMVPPTDATIMNSSAGSNQRGDMMGGSVDMKLPSLTGAGGSQQAQQQQGGDNNDMAASTSDQKPQVDKATAVAPALDVPVDDYAALPHVIVIYVVNPFSWGSDMRSASCARASWLSLFRAFNAVCSRLNVKRRPQLQLEILSMEQMANRLGMMPDLTDNKGHMDVFDRCETVRDVYDGFQSNDTLRSTVMSVYTAPRILSSDCVTSVQARSMTKFGPGSQLISTVAELELQPEPTLFMVPSTPYHLAPPPVLVQEPGTGKILEMAQDEQVLYLTYCLIGGEFLCAAVTDAEGKLNDSVLINIRAPNRAGANPKYQLNSQILDAMTRLWTWIQGVISVGLCHWRLVIGRLGKIGHGEFRAWTHLLSKSVLRKLSAKSKESCPPCADRPGVLSVPSVLSACLISTEPEPYIRIFPEFFNTDSYSKGKIRPISTPGDVSCTHIMVFPVNTQIDLSMGENAMDDDNGDDWGGLMGEGLGDLDLGDADIATMQGLLLEGADDGGGAQPSASIRHDGNPVFFGDNESTESLQNQPLAIGYFVSTAPPGDLPDWFWASCPSARRRSPTNLKSSLHINVQCAGGDQDQDQGDDFIQNKTTAADKRDHAHPLDSQQTDQVLRHVLETYNALSWLNVDCATGERSCCLPVHMQSLLRLYHSVTRLVV